MKALRLLARLRFQILLTLLLAALFCQRYQAELSPVPQQAIALHAVQASYVGGLDVSVLGRQSGTEIARREAGYGMAYRLQDEVASSQGTRHIFFSRSLQLTDDDVHLVKKNGPTFVIGIAGGEIATLSGGVGTLLSYTRYTKGAASRQRYWFWLAAGLTAAALVLFAVGHIHHGQLQRIAP
jgi:hypothetical protein